MRALQHDDGVRLVDAPDPTPGEGEALVRVRLAGVCNTDLEVVRGYMGYRGIMGHEMVGEVEACDADPSLVGRRVTGEINVVCGRCDLCQAGLGTHCRQRTVMGIAGHAGCFAERLTLPVANLHVVPDSVPDEAAVFAEPLAAAYEIPTQIDLAAHERIAVLGDGKLGLLIGMALHERGGNVTQLGRHAHKLAIARATGAAVMQAGDGEARSFDLVVEATGSPDGLAHALSLVRPRGTLVLKSTFHGTPQLDTTRIVVDEITLLGSRCGPFEVALDALARGSVDPRPLIEQTYALADGVEAVEHAGRRGTLKILIAP